MPETTTTADDLRSNPELEDDVAELVEEIVVGHMQSDNLQVLKDQLNAALVKLIDDRIKSSK